ncbi:MAG: Vesicle-trafficking protein S22b, partial [Paramarteilia canceri]
MTGYITSVVNAFFSNYPPKALKEMNEIYQCIEFEVSLQQIQNEHFYDRKSEFDNLNNELKGVRKIMLSSIDDILKRGDALEQLEAKSAQVQAISNEFRKKASRLNKRQYGAMILLFLTLLL